MPSGAKKRKAAKKKKESGAQSNQSSNNNTNPPGIDEVKTQDSDGSGLSTPASQDRDNHQSPFDVGGEDLEKRDPSPIESFTGESKSIEGATGNGEGTEKVIAEGEGVVEVVRELVSHGDAESKIISIEHVQSSKGSLNKDGSSSSSDSDDDSSVDEKKEKEEASNSVVEEPSFTNLVSGQVNQLVEKAKAVEVSHIHYKDNTISSGSLSDDESRVDEKKVTEEACNSAVEEPHSSTDLVPKEVSQPKEEATVVEVFSSVSGNAPDSDRVKPVVPVSEEVIHVKECVSIQNSGASDLANSVMKENGEKLFPKTNGLTGASPTGVDSESKNVEDKSLPIFNKNGDASADTVKPTPEEFEGKVVSSSHGANDKTGNGTEHTKNSEIPQYPENEHQLPVVAPRTAQTTSWKGCCGLFEVLIGSSR